MFGFIKTYMIYFFKTRRIIFMVIIKDLTLKVVRYIGLEVKNIVVNGVDIRFMTLVTDG